MHFMAKVEVAIDKSRNAYERVREYYRGRNSIGHGGEYSAQFVLQDVAQFMEDLSAEFPSN